MNKEYSFEQAVQLLFDKLGNWKIMALASCVDSYPMVRNVGCLFYDERIYFKTDKNFRKTKQLYENPKVALCWNGVQMEGKAAIKGLVVEEESKKFETLYKKYLWQSYNKYSHKEDEILVEVEPSFVEIWDTDDENYAHQIFIHFDSKQVEMKQYDKKME